jgi:Ca2+-binding RTX toxin-like protein
MLRRVASLATLSATVGLCLMASAAGAATVEVVDGTAVFTAAPGEANDVRAGTIAARDPLTLKIIDAGAPLTAGPGCQQLDPSSVWCPEAIETPLPLVIRTGDGDDRVLVDDIFIRNVTVLAEDGDDAVVVGSSFGSPATLDGGRGDDTLSTWMNSPGAPVLRGGGGDDVLTMSEAGGGQASGGDGDDRLVYDAFSFGRPVLLDGGDGRDSYALGQEFLPTAMVPGAGRDTLDQGAASEALSFDMADCPGCVERVIGTAFDDDILGAGQGEAILGGDGADDLDGGGGRDRIDGPDGDHRITTNDGMADDVECGAGTDAVTADRRDAVDRAGCESVTRYRQRP